MVHRNFEPHRMSTSRWAARAMALCCLGLCLLSLSGCLDLLKPRQRRFGSTCGVAAECEGGVCYHGHCTTSCKSGAQCGSGVCLDSVCQQSDDDYDLDGLSNAYEVKWKLDPANPDTDGDGIPDGVEIGPDPAHPKDSNGDGIIDALQSNTADADGDCIADAFDKLPGKPDPLPASDKICPFGVCKDNLSQIKVVCGTGPATNAGALVGCPKCQCDGAAVPDWQVTETFCDGKDNDCDGKTDKGLTYNGLPLGAPCVAAHGACQGLTVAGPTKGVVECGTDKATTCSTAANGSKSLAKPEVCNLVDDDCDGVTDNGFALNGQAVGQPCGTCTFSGATCQSGAPANPAVVTCTADGTAALCSGIPFASGFDQLTTGAPQTHLAWSAAVSPTWKRVVSYGGQVPGAYGAVDRDDQWTLDVSEAGKAISKAANWQRLNGMLPGRRSKSALFWDGNNDRMVLLGGEVDGQPDAEVKQFNAQGEWQDLSALPQSDAAFVAQLTTTNAMPIADPQASAHAVAVTMGAGATGLIAFLPGDPTPVWSAAQGGKSWQQIYDPTGSLGGEVACVAPAPTGTYAVALTQTGAVFRLQVSADGSQIEATPLTVSGTSPALFAPQCAHDGLLFHVFGGYDAARNDGGYRTGALSGDPSAPTGIVFAPATDPTGTDAAMQRAGGFAAWNAAQGLVFGGGVRFEGPAGQPHAVPRSDVWAVVGQSPPQRLDAPAPEGRIGQASGWSKSHKAFCIAGGLTLSVPTAPGLPVFGTPATDAWCMDATGTWQRLSSPIKPFAFGMAAIDAKGDRFVLAGGLDLAEGQTLTDIGRLWAGDLTQNGVHDAAWHPTAAVQTIALATGDVTAQAPMPSKAATVAPAAALDPVRNRLIWFGGFNANQETQNFFALQLDTLAFVDLHPDPIGASENVPQPRYGALALYDPYRDVFALKDGFIRTFSNGKPGTVGIDGFPGGDDPCYGALYGSLWAATTGVAPLKPTFQAFPVPNFAESNPVGQPLLRAYFTGPAFLPVLYDALGGHGWLAVPQSNIKGQFYASNVCTVIPDQVAYATTDVQLTLDIGSCGPAQPVAASVKTTALQNTPTTLLMAAAAYIEADRRSLLWGGLDQDYTPSAVSWRLDQGCK